MLLINTGLIDKSIEYFQLHICQYLEGYTYLGLKVATKMVIHIYTKFLSPIMN